MKTFWNGTESVTNQNISAEGIVNLIFQHSVKQQVVAIIIGNAYQVGFNLYFFFHERKKANDERSFFVHKNL